VLPGRQGRRRAISIGVDRVGHADGSQMAVVSRRLTGLAQPRPRRSEFPLGLDEPQTSWILGHPFSLHRDRRCPASSALRTRLAARGCHIGVSELWQAGDSCPRPGCGHALSRVRSPDHLRGQRSHPLPVASSSEPSRTGRVWGLLRRARGYEADLADGRTLWDVMSERYGITLEVSAAPLRQSRVRDRSVVSRTTLMASSDGLALGRLLSERRGGDFRILAHSVFEGAPELRRASCPSTSRDARGHSQEPGTRRARPCDYLSRGRCHRCVSRRNGLDQRHTVRTALDPVWRSFTAKLAASPGTTVVPLFLRRCQLAPVPARFPPAPRPAARAVDP
jgi:hypothetical protein